MVLLKPKTTKGRINSAMNLHSTMVLLKLKSLFFKDMTIGNLHSTMVLLKQEVKSLEAGALQ